MPREFYYQNTSRFDCNNYIDMLAQKRIADAKACEDKGLVTDLVYEPGAADSSDRPFVNVTPERLLALLRGEEVLEVPIDARIRFKPLHNRYTSNDVDAAIFANDLTEEYYKVLKKRVGEGMPIVAVHTPEELELLEKYGFRLIDSKMHSASNLDIACESLGITANQQAVHTNAPPAPIDEIEISSEAHRTHTETVTLIAGQGRNPYFVRRLLRDQYLLWSGTSFTANGPWTEYYRDQARLTALDITPV